MVGRRYCIGSLSKNSVLHLNWNLEFNSRASFSFSDFIYRLVEFCLMRSSIGAVDKNGLLFIFVIFLSFSVYT